MAGLDLSTLQGNIVRGYGVHFTAVRHLVLRVADPTHARAALADMLDGGGPTPQITGGDAHPKRERRQWALNVGVTHHGLTALGVPKRHRDTFPPEFRQGMVDRAPRIGDVGPSAPSEWAGGFNQPERVDVIVTVSGRRPTDTDTVAEQVRRGGGGRAWELVSAWDGQALEDPAETGPSGSEPEPNGRLVHFGFRDGIAQPRFVGVHGPEEYPDEARSPLGVALLGHPTAIPGLRWRVPGPPPLGHNGTFSAFRLLRQDVSAFEALIDRTAQDAGVDRELVAAKMCGRWRNGAPLAVAPTWPEAQQLVAGARTDRALRETLNRFGYAIEDPAGLRCPVGAHIRRANPRDGRIVNRASAHTARIIRRAMPFGPRYRSGDDIAVPRGLVGHFICASLAAQFEVLQGDWLGLGLQHPDLTGTNDPLVGANGDLTSRFEWPDQGTSVVMGPLPRLVRTEGGAYCFLPSIPALRWIAGARWAS